MSARISRPSRRQSRGDRKIIVTDITFRTTISPSLTTAVSFAAPIPKDCRPTEKHLYGEQRDVRCEVFILNFEFIHLKNLILP
jgi:hypothetical protein